MAHWVENKNAEWKIMANTCTLFDCTSCLKSVWTIQSLYMTILDDSGGKKSSHSYLPREQEPTEPETLGLCPHP